MIKLPKPVGRICKYVGPGNADAPKIITRSFDEFPVGLYPDFWKDKENLYTEKQLKKAVRDALEEAAKRIAGYDDFPVYEMLANEIRQRKEGL